jgi:energy-coupling factor transporter ATP-binding protein EcfA2
MRKLTVKNFSVIKEAELEFGKITVLIGPQSSGKSLLCKLAYFLSKQTIEQALNAILRKDTFEELRTTLIREFTAWFPVDTWVNADSNVRFESSSFRLQISGYAGRDGFHFEADFSTQFESLFSSLADQIIEYPDTGSDSRKYLVEQVEARLNLLLTDSFVHRSVYIPDGRAFFANQSLGFLALKNADIDPVVREFSLEVRLGDSWKPNPIAGHKALQVLDEIRREMNSIAGGYIEGRNASARFKRTSDGRAIPLALLSSGTQEILPLLNVLGQVATGQRDRIIFPRPNNLPAMPREIILSKGLIYLEEPEANVFPDTQYQLVRLFARLSHEPTLDFSWVITTHSPYILSAFNNLIYAGQLGVDKTNRKKIPVDEKYWIEPGTFAAYCIHDGVLKPILSKSGLIDGEYLDSISESIGNEFDKLLRLEYDKTKAS